MADIQLDTPVRYLPKVGEARAKQLEKLGITRVYDLLTFFPRRYDDWSECVPLFKLEHDKEQSFIATIVNTPRVSRNRGKTTIFATLSDGSCSIRAVWFNQPYLEKKMTAGEEYFFHGRITRDGFSFQVVNPVFDQRQKSEEKTSLIQPVYPLTSGLKQGHIRAIVNVALDRALPLLSEVLPLFFRKEQKLCAIRYAYEKIHRPESMEEVEIAQKYLIYEELFLLRAALSVYKQEQKDLRASCPIRGKKEDMERFAGIVKGLPFSLTEDQSRVTHDILSDISAAHPMNRLVQGDVGSGKTVVAFLSMAACAIAGYQSVFMAPTAVLASQHYETFKKFLNGSDIDVELMLGSTTAKKKNEIREGLRNGKVKMLVGTHAVLSEKNEFSDLALMVTDEQHRFGVKQRSATEEREDHGIHTLVMSATPIPRTLGLVLFGDMDVSVIKSMPKGRQPIKTIRASFDEDGRVLATIRQEVKKGHQAYVVCPMIDELQEDAYEDEEGTLAEKVKSDLESAVQYYETISSGELSDMHVGLLHGKMKPVEKEKIMKEFSEGAIDVLVSTTVIEVGVDNPNASLMIIRNAERFGLSTLHQLRGRIGRGSLPSLCILQTDKYEGVAQERIDMMCNTTDGFELAEKDMLLRGTGDFFGTKQHGIPQLKMANLYRDAACLGPIEDAIGKMLKEDPGLQKTEAKIMLQAFHNHFGDAWTKPSL
ncbi:MAG: ATP-dependent DNA helicase RecG [Clostridiales bacterium]|nr:ATP-dependent DNA helicase RecG [Clostridiales bacterium]